AEDGIRDRNVTGVQTCALPISEEAEAQAGGLMEALARSATPPNMHLFIDKQLAKKVWEVRESSLGAISHVPGEPLTWEGWEDSRSEERRVGKECRSRWARYQKK